MDLKDIIAKWVSPKKAEKEQQDHPYLVFSRIRYQDGDVLWIFRCGIDKPAACLTDAERAELAEQLGSGEKAICPRLLFEDLDFSKMVLGVDDLATRIIDNQLKTPDHGIQVVHLLQNPFIKTIEDVLVMFEDSQLTHAYNSILVGSRLSEETLKDFQEQGSTHVAFSIDNDDGRRAVSWVILNPEDPVQIWARDGALIWDNGPLPCIDHEAQPRTSKVAVREVYVFPPPFDKPDVSGP